MTSSSLPIVLQVTSGLWVISLILRMVLRHDPASWAVSVVSFGAVLVATVALGLPVWVFLAGCLGLIVFVCAIRIGIVSRTRSRVIAAVILGVSAVLGLALFTTAGNAFQWRLVVSGIAILIVVVAIITRRKILNRVIKNTTSTASAPRIAARAKYLYWSQRRITAVVSNYGISIPMAAETTVKSPPMPAIPSLEIKRQSRPVTRAEVANTISDQLERHGLVSMDALLAREQPTRPSFLTGVGTMSFSEFRGSETLGNKDHLAMALSFYPMADGAAYTAVCLYCSMDNFSEFIQEVGLPMGSNWSFSSSPAVANFIASAGKRDPRSPYSNNDIAIESVKLALDHRDVRPSEVDGWIRRPFAFAEVNGTADWTAEVYYDAVLDYDYEVFARGPVVEEDVEPIVLRRIIIGAPLWIRTRSLRSVRLVDEWSEEEIDQETDRRSELRRRLHKWAKVARLLSLDDAAIDAALDHAEPTQPQPRTRK